jgi:hypothetical protein
MTSLLMRGSAVLREVASLFRARRETWPIDSLKELERFVRTRSAFIAQKKLYGYLKTRMGTRYATVFENEVFMQSVNIAKMHIFASCLSDMTVHAVARATAGSGIDHDRRVAVAMDCYRAGIAESGGEPPEPGAAERWIDAFEQRLRDVAWENIAAGGDAFVTSPKALVRWAPIADELKRYDAEIVRNSVRFAWIEVIQDFRKRCNVEKLAAEIISGAVAPGRQ